MNELYLHGIKDIKIAEKRFPEFTDFEVVIGTREGTFHITLFPDDDGIKWFQELDEVIVDLEAHPDTLQGCIERLKKLVPLERIKKNKGGLK